MKSLSMAKTVFLGGMATGAATLAPSVFAVDRTDAITAASDEAKANYVAVIGAVFAIAIVGFGFAALLGWIRR